jgi:hypothetical protein
MLLLLLGDGAARTWYLVRRVLHTPVSNIIPTRKGIMALEAILGWLALRLHRWFECGVLCDCDNWRRELWLWWCCTDVL